MMHAVELMHRVGAFSNNVGSREGEKATFALF